MSELRFFFALQLRNDSLSQYLAQLDAPLIKGVDAPDGSLGKDRVLIESNQLAERFRCEPIVEDSVRRTVAFENPVRHEPIRRSLRFDLLRRLSKGQRLG